MKQILRLVAVLSVLCAVSAGLLAVVAELTREPIAQALREEKLRALRQVLPPYDNEPDRDTVTIDGLEIYIARQGGQVVGYAFPSVDSRGYSGDIEVLVGVDLDSLVTGIQILRHAETPGLGTKIAEPDFLATFRSKGLDNADWRVRKDGGEFPEFAGATVSPRAVVGAVEGGLRRLAERMEQLRQHTGGPGEPEPGLATPAIEPAPAGDEEVM